MKIKRIAALLLTFTVLGLGFAQMKNPASWQFKTKQISDNETELQFIVTLDQGWHIYSQHTDPNGPIGISFQFDNSKDYKRLSNVKEPKAHEEFDDMFKCTVRSFDKSVTFRQRIKVLTDKDFKVTGTMSYQLCNDGSCIPPDDEPFSFNVKGAKLTDTTAVAVADTTVADTVATTDENTDTAAVTAVADTKSDNEKKDKEKSLLIIFLLALGGGILTMFTPCVFPMIPMTVNFFMHNSGNKRKGRRQAWFFGFSIVFIFAVIGGVLSALLGPEELNTIATNWIPNLIFFAIFFVFALSFFGLFEIKMPEKWINSSDKQADKGGLLAPFFIALTTVLVSFSCTGPIIGGALVGLTTTAGADAETANRWVSLLVMLGFGIGFAAPFTLLAFFPQFLKNMKSGSWLNTVKVSFAFIELAFGLKFLQMADIDRNWGLLPRDIYLALWIVIFGLWGLYLLGKIRFKGDEEMKHIGIGRLMLAILDLAFVVYMIPGLWGAELKALSGLVPPFNSQEFSIQKVVKEFSNNDKGSLPSDRKYADRLSEHTPMGFEAFYDLEEAKAYAREQGKPVFIDFTGKNCGNCREMEHYIWPEPKVKELLTNEFIIVSLFTDENTIDLPESEWVTDDRGRTLKTLGRRNGYLQRSQFNMNAQPYYVIINSDGKVLTKENYKYDRDVQKFIGWLNEGLENYKNGK
ncbi:MAG: thioredoxin family protein [Bacteroidales bacterium]|nr:thioredoxin family protein [Bacteroidales bacterium]